MPLDSSGPSPDRRPPRAAVRMWTASRPSSWRKYSGGLGAQRPPPSAVRPTASIREARRPAGGHAPPALTIRAHARTGHTPCACVVHRSVHRRNRLNPLPPPAFMTRPPALAVTRLGLSHFRSHRGTGLALDPRPVAVFGPNGAGKTNLIEAVSLLSPGRGLRGAAAEEMARTPEKIGWKVTAALEARETATRSPPGPKAPAARSRSTASPPRRPPSAPSPASSGSPPPWTASGWRAPPSAAASSTAWRSASSPTTARPPSPTTARCASATA